jgi:hypothetical protein
VVQWRGKKKEMVEEVDKEAVTRQKKRGECGGV